MTRYIFLALGSLLTAAIIHIGTIFAIPFFSPNDIWHRSAKLGPDMSIHVLANAQEAFGAFPELDPHFAYAACRIPDSNAPVQLTGSIMSEFWSLSYIDKKGQNQFALTNQISGSDLNIVLATRGQQRLLSEKPDLFDETAVMVTAKGSAGLLFVRAFVARESERDIITRDLKALSCKPLWDESDFQTG